MLIKLAYDSDWETDKEYGICANRPLGPGHDLHHSLKSAAKDPNISSLGLGMDDDTSREHVHKFLKKNKNERFDWNVGMRKDHKMFNGQENKHKAILDYLHQKHGF